MTRTHRSSIVTLVLFLSAGSPGQAQEVQPERGIVGTGVVVINRPPERMRVQILLRAKGSTLKEALASLKTRGDAARKQLIAQGADRDSIELNGPRVSNPQSANQRSMRGPPRAGQRVSRRNTIEPVVATATLTADLVLEGKTLDDRLLAARSLQDKIRAADHGGAKDAGKLSPEEQEVDEEQQPETNNGESAAGEPIFWFVSRISDADRDRALAEAFQKAKGQALRLAKAAGTELGGLKSLTAMNVPQLGNYDFNSPAFRALQAAQTAQAEIKPDQNDTEAVGLEAGAVKMSIAVTAGFDVVK